MLIEKSEILEYISKHFRNKEFTMREVYYGMFNTWNKPRFGSLFSQMKSLTKSGVLLYEVKAARPREGYKGKQAFYKIRKAEEARVIEKIKEEIVEVKKIYGEKLEEIKKKKWWQRQ